MKFDIDVEGLTQEIDINEIAKKKITSGVRNYINHELNCEETYSGNILIGGDFGEKVKPVIDKKVSQIIENNVEQIVEKVFDKKLTKIINDLIDSDDFRYMVFESTEKEMRKHLKNKLK